MALFVERLIDKQKSHRSINRRIAYLDGWRGVSILIVFVGHFLNAWVDESISEIGVDLFFVLSGRLMCEILFERRTHLPLFFMRRFSRVYPGLVCFVLLAALIFSDSSIKVGVMGMISALTFTLNYAMIYFHHTGIFDHLWSLCVEEHAYILLGILAFYSRRLGGNAAWIILACGLTALANGLIQSLVFGRSHFDVFWRTDVKVAGIFLAGGFYLALRHAPLRIKTVLATLSLLLAFAMKIALTGPLASFGFWSYSLYLWQQPFYKLIGSAPLWQLVSAAIVCGLLSFYLIERPVRAVINNRVGPMLERHQANA